jgi:hypothetical protein
MSHYQILKEHPAAQSYLYYAPYEIFIYNLILQTGSNKLKCNIHLQNSVQM